MDKILSSFILSLESIRLIRIDINFPELLLGLFLGFLLSIIPNHWYSVDLRKPNLLHTGHGGGSIAGTNYHYHYVAIHNELRRFVLRLNRKGRRILKLQFFKQVIKRDAAEECTATLFDASGAAISALVWTENQTSKKNTTILSGESKSLATFLVDGTEYLVYRPASDKDPTPQLLNVPRFSQPAEFVIGIYYSFNSEYLRIPVKVCPDKYTTWKMKYLPYNDLT